MKKIILTLLLILFLYSCSNVPVFESDEFGNLIDRANDRLYLYSGSHLRASTIIEEPFARYDGDRTLHEIPGVDPAEWLSDNIRDLGMPLLFRESSIEEPTLENFGTERIHVTQVGDINTRIQMITDERHIQQIVDDYVHGESVNRPLDVDRRLLFYFESPDYPGIYYVLDFFIGTDGREYLFNRWKDRCVIVTPFN